MPRLPLLLLLLLSFAGCITGEAPPATDAEPGDSVPPPPYSIETLPPDTLQPVRRRDSLPPRPAELRDSIRIEGTAQAERLTLVRSPEWFQPPFSTYLPSQLRVDFTESDSVPSVRFVTAFAGKVNPDAYLQVRLYPRGASELVARTAVDVYLRGRDPRQDAVSRSQRWPWLIEAYDFHYGEGPQNSGFLGTIGSGRHGDRYFHVLAHYPAEYGDGAGPRFARILREWRWEDDGSMLVPR